MKARTADFSLQYNKFPVDSDIGPDIQSVTYTDCAAEISDSISIELDAQEEKWRGEWMPDEGATLYPKIIGRNWNREGDKQVMDCGLFILDDLQYSANPTTLQIGAVARPSDTDFSECHREQIYKNTSIARIGRTIAARYGLGFSIEAEDYGIECWEQDGTDSSEYNTLCKNYGLTMKVYAKRLWVYDREKMKAKPAVKTIRPEDVIKSGFSWKKGIAGTYTGGYFSYTDADRDCDITASVGGGNRTKSVNRYASSVADAAVQLVAEINNANHGQTSASIKLMGCFDIASGMNVRLEGFGSAVDGKYFVDKVTHSLTRGGGFTSSVECSLCTKGFSASDVGGNIQYRERTTTTASGYTSTYETTVAAANAASANAGAAAAASVTLKNAPFYYTSVAKQPSCYKSGTYYFYDGILVAGRYRMTNLASRCGKQPVGQNVTGWVPAAYCK